MTICIDTVVMWYTKSVMAWVTANYCCLFMFFLINYILYTEMVYMSKIMWSRMQIYFITNEIWLGFVQYVDEKYL